MPRWRQRLPAPLLNLAHHVQHSEKQQGFPPKISRMMLGEEGQVHLPFCSGDVGLGLAAVRSQLPWEGSG